MHVVRVRGPRNEPGSSRLSAGLLHCQSTPVRMTAGGLEKGHRHVSVDRTVLTMPFARAPWGYHADPDPWAHGSRVPLVTQPQNSPNAGEGGGSRQR